MGIQRYGNTSQASMNRSGTAGTTRFEKYILASSQEIQASLPQERVSFNSMYKGQGNQYDPGRRTLDRKLRTFGDETNTQSQASLYKSLLPPSTALRP